MMIVRQLREEDLEEAMRIYASARAFMKRIGNGSQWKDSWPPREILEQDIRNKNAYAVEDSNTLKGVFVYWYGDHAESDYDQIFEGSWMQDGPYGVVHRIAALEGSHAGRFALRWAMKQCGHMRIDTHENNKAMIHTLEQLGFSRRGIIYLKNGESRLAFEVI